MNIAVASFGDKGSLACDANGFTDGKVFPAKHVVNTVGAGDSFIAGFMYGVLNNLPVVQCLETGSKVAAQVVQVFEPWVTEA